MKAPVDEMSATGSTETTLATTTTGTSSSVSNTGTSCSFIKPSLSMTSLPPDGQQDGSEVIKAKLRVERPYNSLKKKRNSERDLWRHSWGSGNSHSSCSLHNSAVGLKSGKDDFWAALQTNYNYIMDTNLLDTCHEARCEIEGTSNVVADTSDYCNKMLLQSSKNEGLAEDPKELRRWLREMESKLENAPSLHEATQMSIAELQRRLAEHSVLYYEIVSHARVVGACVRASEKENDHSISSEEKTPSPNGNKKIDGNLKGLERRYHLLYLKAIEVQCLFEGLLGKKNSSSVLSRASSTETDDEPASKLARFSDSETQTHVSDDLLSREHTISDENKSEGDEEEGEDWPDLAFNATLTVEQLQETNVDFDADSEGSDCEEVIIKELNRHSGKKDKINRFNKSKNDSVLSENMDSNLYKNGSIDFMVTEKKLQNSNQNINRSPSSRGSVVKRQRSVDTSKFNESNRKSKNCATFYFKHLDTDNENFGLSSQGSDALKSGEPSSDDEGWLFSNESITRQNGMNDDSDKENKEIESNVSELQGSLVNLSNGERDPKDLKNIESSVSSVISNEDKEHTTISSLKSENPMETINMEDIADLASEKNDIPSEIKLEMADKSNKECSHESIKQLVLDAENLVREEAMKTPIKKKQTILKMSTIIKKREITMPGTNIQRVQEWLEHQPIVTKDTTLIPISTPTTDCEASGEYTESDSAGARESDTSEGFTDSVATCMQTGSNSQCTSTEIIGGSAEPISNVGSNPSLTCTKVVRRTNNRRNSDRPWSVSCLSQLTESDTINADKVNNNQGLASHSISESALHILSSPGRRKQSPQTPVKNSDSKNSLKRRKARRRKITGGKRSDSGSDGLLPYDLPKLTQTLMKSESLSGQLNIIQDLTMALSMLSLPKNKKPEEKSTSEMESEEEQALMKPNFKLGSYTSAYMTNESKLGSLAALANYMHEEQGEYNTGTEDHSSFSEQAWDNYQEKYNSENYSEGLDSDAARRLLEFADDYRNFMDSQSDCCSSLSAANNLDSLSPPRMDSLKQTEVKITQQTITSDVDHARRRRALDLEYERRRRKSVEMKKKSSQDEIHYLRSPNSSCTLNPSTPKSNDKSSNRSINDVTRKLDFDTTSSAQSLRKTSESDTSLRRRKSEDVSTRRRSSRTLEKSFKAIPSTSSSSNDDSDDEKEMKSLLAQSRNRLENTNALKIRSHLLRPEDYAEIIATCRDNIRCLESVLRGPPGTVLSTARSNETRDVLSSWENLLAWSENAAAARKMQEDMIILKNALNRLGKQICDFDSEASIQFVIEELKNEKTQLQGYRTNMLRLNASVHSWLTRQEMKLKKELEALANETENNNVSQEKGSQIDTIAHSESEFHKHLKDEVSEMYSAWDEADLRINNHLEALTASLIAWRQLECGLSEFHQVLGKDRGTLKGLEGALNRGQATSLELAQNVKLVAKLLSEKVDCTQQQIVLSPDEPVDPNIIPVAQFTSSNGSLSDSGISDGGATSDGGLSERERRLGVLRRLAKQLESALAPGSEALKSITARMEAAEAELKTLQNTCRELIVRTAVTQHKKSQALLTYNTPNGSTKSQQRIKKSPTTKRKNKRKSITGPVTGSLLKNQKRLSGKQFVFNGASGDPGDPKGDPWSVFSKNDDDSDPKSGWAWRVAKIAFPVQLALLTLFCAACLMEPHCCDSLNNLSMSFTPQLRYIRGPPPI